MYVVETIFTMMCCGSSPDNSMLGNICLLKLSTAGSSVSQKLASATNHDCFLPQRKTVSSTSIPLSPSGTLDSQWKRPILRHVIVKIQGIGDKDNIVKTSETINISHVKNKSSEQHGTYCYSDNLKPLASCPPNSMIKVFSLWSSTSKSQGRTKTFQICKAQNITCYVSFPLKPLKDSLHL